MQVTRILVVVSLAALAGCSTVQRESQRARAVVVRAGERVESRVDAAADRARTWWQRLFPPRSSSSRRVARRNARPETNASRYETVQPRYVGAEAGEN